LAGDAAGRLDLRREILTCVVALVVRAHRIVCVRRWRRIQQPMGWDGMGWLVLLLLLLVARAPFSAHHVNHIAGVLIDTRPPISDGLIQPLHSLLRYFRLQSIAYLISI